MPNSLNISNTTSSNQSGSSYDYSVEQKTIEGATNSDETTYINSNFSKQLGYFYANADLKSAILSKATWVVGKGWTADPETSVILDHIKGWGKDTFDDIIYNMDILRRIGGDSYAEIIRDEKTGIIVNLKPLDPATMRHVVDKKGMLKRFEQVSAGGKDTIEFKPEDIFYVPNNRIADQIHGLSDIDAMEQTLLAENESFNDMKKIMHRQAKPLIMFKLGTDNAAKISAFVAKMDSATRLGENIYIPDDANSVSYEVVQVTPSPLVLNWRDDIRKKFYRTIGLPELLPDSSGATESGGKIGYLCFEQIVEKEQRFWEQQIWNQLQLKINLIPPASLSTELQTDNSKDGAAMGLTMQPSDTQAGVGR